MVAEQEDAFEYELLLMGLKAEYSPCTMSEVKLVERLANLVRRERRLAETEAAMLEKLNIKADMFAEVMLDRHVELEKQQLVGRYQGMLGRQISETRRELRVGQARRSAMSALDAMR